MILCDTGPLVALLDRDDAHHARCSNALGNLPPTQLLTTWPCLTEGMYLLGRIGGLRAQNALWDLIADGLVVVDPPDPSAMERMRALMATYADSPMDFADASLVVLAEARSITTIFSLDRHFRGYRTRDGQAFTLVP